MQKQTSRVSTLILAVLMVLLASNIMAAPPRQTTPPELVTYQGHLLDDDNNPVPDGEYSMVFELYDNADEGTLLWGPETHTVSTSSGYFAVRWALTSRSAPAPSTAPLIWT
jgi:hypothetical protein